MNCDPNSLVKAASCFQCLSAQQLEMVKAYLLCQIIATGGGGGGGTGAVSSGHGAPSFTPTTSTAIYFDEDSGTQYNYFNGAWH